MTCTCDPTVPPAEQDLCTACHLHHVTTCTHCAKLHWWQDVVLDECGAPWCDDCDFWVRSENA